MSIPYTDHLMIHFFDWTSPPHTVYCTIRSYYLSVLNNNQPWGLWFIFCRELIHTESVSVDGSCVFIMHTILSDVWDDSDQPSCSVLAYELDTCCRGEWNTGGRGEGTGRAWHSVISMQKINTALWHYQDAIVQNSVWQRGCQVKWYEYLPHSIHLDTSTVSPPWKCQHVIVYGLYNIVCAVQIGHIYFIYFIVHYKSFIIYTRCKGDYRSKVWVQ